MPSLDTLRRINNNKGKTLGEYRKLQSDKILEASWDGDINSKIGYLYDQFHDEEFDKEKNLTPYKTNKIPVEVKLFTMQYNSLAKDEVPFHIQFKPSFECNVPYYYDMFEKTYKASFPIGLYLDYPDEKGNYQRWLIVAQYGEYFNQFPTYLVLPVNHKLQWVKDRQKYESWCVLRSQSSYNSGEWTAYKITSPENQKLVWLPMNKYSSKIFYNQRIIISEPREEPVVWRNSKVEDMAMKGIVKLTFAQDRYDNVHDYIEKDSDGNVIGMWANYYDAYIEPKEVDNELYKSSNRLTCEIVCDSDNSQLKVGGGYRNYTVNFYNGGLSISPIDGVWNFYYLDEDGFEEDVSEYIEIDTPDMLEFNKVRFKFLGDDDFIGTTIYARFTDLNEEVESVIKIEIVGL